MLRLLFKILVCLLINFFIIKSLYIGEVNQAATGTTYIRQVYSGQSYKFWTKIDGTKYCSNIPEEEQNNLYSSLSSITEKNVNVVYFQNVDLFDCKDKIERIAKEFHAKDIAIAFDLEKQFDYENAFGRDFSGVKVDFYKEKFKDFGFINDWVDYLVFNNAMQYLTFNERRIIQGEIRKIFIRPFLGFRFLDFDIKNIENVHSVRNDRKLKEFMPQDDEGDFIITSMPIPSMKRTVVFVEKLQLGIPVVNGEFVS